MKLWMSVLLAAADDPSTVLPLVGAGGAGMSAVLMYFLLDEKKERRAKETYYNDALKAKDDYHNEIMEKIMPVLASVAAMQDRVLNALAPSVEYHDRRLEDPEVLRRAYDKLERLLDEYPPASSERRRSRGSE